MYGPIKALEDVSHGFGLFSSPRRIAGVEKDKRCPLFPPGEQFSP